MLDIERDSHRPPSYKVRIWRETHTDHQVIKLEYGERLTKTTRHNARYGERLTQTTKL